MYCYKCGKEIVGYAAVCPFCGALQQNAFPESKKPINGVGIAGFIVSLISIWLGIYFCIVSIVGFVLSIVSVAMMNKYSLNGFAIAGLAIGTVSLISWGIVWLVVGKAILLFMGII